MRCRKPCPAPLPLRVRDICRSAASSAALGECPRVYVSGCEPGSARSSSRKEADVVALLFGEITPVEGLPDPLGSFSTDAVTSTI